MSDALARLVRSTAFRSVAVYVALFVAAMAIAATILLVRTNEDMGDSVLKGLARERDGLSAVASSRGLTALGDVVTARSESNAGLYFLADADGRRVAGNLPRFPPELGLSGGGAVFRFSWDGNAGNSDRLAAGLVLAISGGARLVIARDIEDQRQLAARLRSMFLWSIALLALAGLAGGVLASRVMLRRIETVNRTAQSIMAGDLARRIPTDGSADEFDDLAGNLNRMLERIEELMAGLRQVSDNIAHDLKTPLTRLRSRVEGALRDARGADAWREGLERSIEEADDLIKTFNAMLLVARLEAGAVAESFVTVDLADVVADVAELYEPVAEEAGLSFGLEIARHPRVRVNREMIGQALANLVDNAIKYSAGVAASDAPSVSVSLRQSEEGVVIRVADRGPGIAAQDRERALRRFVRLEASRTRPGTGLGLSLVAAVARLHGGTVKLDDHRPGLIVSLVLPLSCLVADDGLEDARVAAEHNGGSTTWMARS